MNIENSITVTNRAAEVMRTQLKKRETPDAAIRFGIRGGGCTGYSYVFEFEEGNSKEGDYIIDVFGVKIFIDPKSMLLVKGTILDFETGIRGHGFRFENPNVSDSCGCGESVSF